MNDLDAALDAELATMQQSGTNPAAAGDGTAAANATPAADAAAQTAATPPAPQPSPALGDAAAAAAPAGNAAAGSQTPAPDGQAQAAAVSPMRQFAQQIGINVANYADDNALQVALVAHQQHLQSQMQHLTQMAQYGQLYLRGQAAPAPQAGAPNQAATPDPLAKYKAPEYDPSWLQSLEDDGQGGIKLKPGADPAILPKFYAFQQFRKSIADSFMADPVGFMTPLIQHMVEKQAAELVKSQLGEFQQSTYTSQWMQQNDQWLWQRDAAGNKIVNPATNRPIPTVAAERFLAHLNEADSMGIKDPKAQENYARALLMAEMSQPATATQAAVAAGQQKREQILQTMNRAPNASGSLVAQDATGSQAPAQQNSQLSLKDQLLQNLRAQGVTDASFAV